MSEVKERTVQSVEEVWKKENKSISKVTFTDGEWAKFWGGDKFGTPVAGGATAPSVIDMKPDRQDPNKKEPWLTQFGEPVDNKKGPFGGGGKWTPKNPHEIAAVALQYAMTCATNLTSNLVTNGALFTAEGTDAVRPNADAALAFHDRAFKQMAKSFSQAMLALAKECKE